MTTLNIQTAAVKDIPNFWLHDPKRSKIIPLMMVANKNCSKIFGLGVDSTSTLNQEQIAVYYAGGKRSQMLPSEKFYQYLSRWVGIDITLDEDHVVVLGDFNDTCALGCFTFDEKMTIVKFISIEAKSVNRLYRITGLDLFVIGGVGELMIYSFEKKNFALEKKFSIKDCGEIIDISVQYNKTYLLDNSGKVFVRETKIKLDEDEQMKKGKARFTHPRV